jgi:hypothetical protein
MLITAIVFLAIFTQSLSGFSGFAHLQMDKKECKLGT